MKIILEVKSEWKIFWPENDHFRIMLSEMIRKWSFSDQKIYFYWKFQKLLTTNYFTDIYCELFTVSFIWLLTANFSEKFTDSVIFNLVY